MHHASWLDAVGANHITQQSENRLSVRGWLPCAEGVYYTCYINPCGTHFSCQLPVEPREAFSYYEWSIPRKGAAS